MTNDQQEKWKPFNLFFFKPQELNIYEVFLVLRIKTSRITQLNAKTDLEQRVLQPPSMIPNQ
jgi:hypothetical protein